MKPIRFLRPAEFEMLDAAQYYEQQATGLGLEFLDKIEAAIQDIRENPERWPIVKSNIRRRLVHRFPFALLYQIDPEEIVIQATMHLHRRPNYWRGR
ncbi:MAG: type II toxin-antitoxin system RelE/ParE family toxin [Verrucomicrobia bacterium]|nr:type II toxin-antitoxin system RelE/ParE family toxin [Verrucomicrobiota bacterium]MCH8514003.1 type II toxin-antitoxin system RelE/ParE family toxin [Kiritimatiellia bacterium]